MSAKSDATAHMLAGRYVVGDRVRMRVGVYINSYIAGAVVKTLRGPAQRYYLVRWDGGGGAYWCNEFELEHSIV